MREVLLIDTACITGFKEKRRVGTSLGIGYIAGVLSHEGISTSILDLEIERKYLLYKGLTPPQIPRAAADRLRKRISEIKPKIVGLATYTRHHGVGIKTAKMCKEIDPDIKVILGGHHVTFMAEDTLRAPWVDVVVRGEGEYTMLELCRHFLENKGALEEIKGIYYRDNGRVKSTPKRPLIHRLDELPFPVRTTASPAGLRGFGEHLIISARGCPGRCTFCANRAFSNSNYRMRSAENVVDEVEYLAVEKGCKRVVFVDDSLTADKERLIKICTLLIKKELNVQWICASRVDTIDDELVALMKRAGCRQMGFGAESGSQKILDDLRKGITVEQIEKAVRLVNASGLEASLSFFIGSPQESRETALETIDFAAHLRKEYNCKVIVLRALLLPGTVMYKQALKMGLTTEQVDYNDSFEWEPITDTRYLSAMEVRSLLFEAARRIEWANTPCPEADISKIHEVIQRLNYG